MGKKPSRSHRALMKSIRAHNEAAFEAVDKHNEELQRDREQEFRDMLQDSARFMHGGIARNQYDEAAPGADDNDDKLRAYIRQVGNHRWADRWKERLAKQRRRSGKQILFFDMGARNR